MSLFDYILLGLALLYLAELIFLRLGLEKTRRYRTSPQYEPRVSVVVAARNEEQNIASCLDSLLRSDYPAGKCEIIVVDDRSTDRTGAIVRDYLERDKRVKLVVSQPAVGGLRGKANALSQGIEESTGEILLFTDADCVVLPSWIRKTVSYYDEGIGVVAGFTLLTADRPFEGMQAIDWFLLFGVAASTAAWNIPLTGVGNNLSVRRSAYEAVGGYRSLPFSVTEDYTLVQAIWQTTRLQIRYPVDPETLVRSKPCTNWRELFRQRQRWSVGGLDMVLRGMLLMSVSFALHLGILISAVLSPLPVLAATVVTKFAGDLIFLWGPISTFKQYRLLKHFPLFECYYTFYGLTISFLALLSKKVVWKERAFRGD